MNWKYFFKLSKWKVAIFLILFLLTSFVLPFFLRMNVGVCGMGPNGVVCGKRESGFYIGYPPYYGDIGSSSDVIIHRFSLTYFIINIAIYYLISSLIMFTYKKIGKQ